MEDLHMHILHASTWIWCTWQVVLSDLIMDITNPNAKTMLTYIHAYMLQTCSAVSEQFLACRSIQTALYRPKSTFTFTTLPNESQPLMTRFSSILLVDMTDCLSKTCAATTSNNTYKIYLTILVSRDLDHTRQEHLHRNSRDKRLPSAIVQRSCHHPSKPIVSLLPMQIVCRSCLNLGSLSGCSPRK